MTTTDTSYKLTAKIEALLRKAEATQFADEAEAFMAKAEQLMLRFGIERAMLDTSRQTKEDIVIRRVTLAGMWQTAWMHGFAAVVRAYGLRVVYEKYGGKTYLLVIGFERDATDVQRMVDSLLAQSKIAMATWWAEFLPHNRHLTNHQRHVEKRSFMESFGRGAARRIRAERSDVIESTDGAALVLVNRANMVDAWISDSFGKLTTTKSRSAVGYSGAAAGIDAGYEAAAPKRDAIK